MKTYRFIKITDNDDHRKFYIDYTSMSDYMYRIRVSILWSKYLNYLEGEGKHRQVYDLLDADWSACCVARGVFRNIEEVRMKRDELIQFYNEKLCNYEQTDCSCVVSLA